jgi:hypothetical protein
MKQNDDVILALANKREREAVRERQRVQHVLENFGI